MALFRVLKSTKNMILKKMILKHDFKKYDSKNKLCSKIKTLVKNKN